MIQSTRGGQGAQGTVAETVEVIQEEVAPTAVPAIEDDEAEVEAVTERTRNKVKTVTRVRNNAGSAVVPASTTLLASGSPGVFRAVAAVPSFGHEFLAAGPQLAAPGWRPPSAACQAGGKKARPRGRSAPLGRDRTDLPGL